MFYKVVYEGTVVDVLNDPRFVKRNKYNLKVLCPKDEATMVLSSDAEVTYTLNDHALLGIPESEYKELKDRLFKSGPIEPERSKATIILTQNNYLSILLVRLLL